MAVNTSNDIGNETKQNKPQPLRNLLFSKSSRFVLIAVELALVIQEISLNSNRTFDPETLDAVSIGRCLEAIFYFVVHHTQGHHLLTEQVLGRDGKRLNVSEYIEAFKCTRYSIRHNLPCHMRNIHTMP